MLYYKKLSPVATELVPELVELAGEGADEAGVGADDDVLLVLEHGAPRPIEAPVEEDGIVEDCELVVHVAEAVAVVPDGDAPGLEAVGLGALVVLLLVVGDDPHPHTPLVSGDDLLGNLRASDGEDAHVHRSPRAPQPRAQPRQARLTVQVLAVVAEATVLPLEVVEAGHPRVGKEQDLLLKSGRGSARPVDGGRGVGRPLRRRRQTRPHVPDPHPPPPDPDSSDPDSLPPPTDCYKKAVFH